MGKIEWTEVGPDEVRPHPSDYECQCSRNEDEYLMHVTEGIVSIEHTVCGKQVADDGYIEVWSTVEPIPVTARFIDLGMSPSTPNGPAEHNGFWWELGPRHPSV